MTLTLSELQSVTDYYWERQPTDILFRSNVLLWYLNDMSDTGGKPWSGGLALRGPVEYGEQNAGAYGRDSVMPLDKKPIMNSWEYQWAAYIGIAIIDMLDKQQNSGDAAIVNLVQARLSNMRKTIRKKMGEDVYTARSTTTGIDGSVNVSFSGMADVFNTSTSTKYGGLAEADIPQWKANVISTSEALILKTLQAIRRTASVDNNKEGEPDLYLTTQTMLDSYSRSLQTQQRFQSSKLADAGFHNVLFEGVPVVSDNNQTAGYCDAINTRYWEIRVHPQYNFTKPVWAHKPEQPDTEICNSRWWGQMICKHRGANCRHTGLTELP